MPLNVAFLIEDNINLRSFIFQTFTVYTVYSDWQSSSAECKSKLNFYLLGDVDLTDPEQACTLIQGEPTGPSWPGIVRELYISTDEGKFEL